MERSNLTSSWGLRRSRRDAAYTEDKLIRKVNRMELEEWPGQIQAYTKASSKMELEPAKVD